MSADASYRKWKTVDSRVQFRDTRRLSVAYEYRGNPNYTQYTGSIQVKLGVYVQNNYLNLEQTELYDWGYTVGLGFPVGQSLIHLNYNYDQTGTTQQGLIRVHTHGFSLGFVFRDLWGMKQLYK